MDNQNRSTGLDTAATCWGVALLAGIVIFAMLLSVADWTVMQALFGGGVAFLVLGILLTLTVGRPLPPLNQVKPAPTAAQSRTPAPAAVAPKPAAAPVAAAAPAAAAPVAEPEAPAPKPAAPVAAPAAATTDGPGTKPATLDKPRGGKGDDLKKIKGVGPKMEEMCNKLGFWHFDQIAAWTPAEVAWVDDNLEGFKGRVSRDEWVSQAKLLAEGGETEFSKKVDKGDVY
ncbi:hypothetical protein [Jannaschia pohangensis]|uniref:Predicted 5' DNA nuclease, flap endonuclease-1-like, helix-3-turn-helix (H3TH) domain n=1 Tax=Jannaschia pohangensis TaxID=390807 RepID=A0A1I3Q3E2_9RHOB|nr:hypothetical protein [Jannaschia pohangensis]SFJ28734.1 Predicted 5' DNA nuclease, flap endonuclease-1-like, helix-3-turn-helix (H3TH) domain [Jannaschia pohangensis]